MNSKLRKLSRLINDMQSLEKELHKYERKYRLRSQDFYRLAHSGKLDQSPDYLMWLGMYETLLVREKEYHRLVKAEIAPIVSALNQEGRGAQVAA